MKIEIRNDDRFIFLNGMFHFFCKDEHLCIGRFQLSISLNSQSDKLLFCAMSKAKGSIKLLLDAEQKAAEIVKEAKKGL